MSAYEVVGQTKTRTKPQHTKHRQTKEGDEGDDEDEGDEGDKEQEQGADAEAQFARQ